MSEAHEDQELREEFGILRRELESSSRIPEFDVMMAKARAEAAHEPAPDDDLAVRRRRRTRIGGWMTLATAAAAVALIFVVDRDSTSDADAEFERLVASYSASTATGTFVSPTSGLLEIPGVDLGAVPSVGDALRGLDRTMPRPDARDGGRDS